MGSPKVVFLANLDCNPDQSAKYLGLEKGATSARIFVVLLGLET
jgi:hypothetical protein